MSEDTLSTSSEEEKIIKLDKEEDVDKIELELEVQSATLPERPFVVKFCDMPDELKLDAVSIAYVSMARYYNEEDMAVRIKTEMEKRYKPTWHVFVGRNFGSSVTYEDHRYIYFYCGHLGFLIFKTYDL